MAAILSPRRAVGAVGGALVAGQWAPASAAVLPAAARAFRIPTRIPAARGVLLTFDDGPHPDGTRAVLAALEHAGITAVFFVCGEQVARHPGVVREITAAGHELGLHGYRHRTRIQWSAQTLADDLRRAVDVVCDVAGVTPRLYRPPHGVFSVTGLRVIRSQGLEPLLWSKWGRDWRRGATPSTIAAAATAGLAAGDVILLHDSDSYGAAESWRATAAAVPLIVESIRSAGLAFASARRGLLPPPVLRTNFA